MTRPLRFLHLTTFYPPYSFGGDAMYLYRLCHMLGDLGHEVDVVHCVDAYHVLHPGEPEIPFKEHPRVTRHELRSSWKGLSPLLTHQTGDPFLKRKQLQSILAAKPYDVMHFHNASLLGPRALTLNPPSSRCVKMYTTHDHWLVCPTHVLYKFNQRPCEKPNCLPCVLLHKRPPQLWRYTGQLARASKHVDQFVSPSRFTAGMHAERGFPQPVAHLPYFIERADDDWRVPSPPPQEKPYFLFVGRLEIIKGLQTVFPLWDRVPDADLLVAGTGTYEAELKRLAAGNPRIKFLGPQPQSALGNLYRHALAVIVPSTTYETFGMILIEGFARKTPSIARRLGALTEVIEESGGGFVYSTDDELLSAMNQIATSPERRAQMGERGYQTFVREWDRDAHIRKYFAFLNDIALRKFGRIPWEEPQPSGVSDGIGVL